MRRIDRLTTQLPGLSRSVVLGALLLWSAEAWAQTTVILPDSSLTTAATINITETATVTIPSTALFAVSNVAAVTSSQTLSISVQDLVRKTTTSGVAVSLRATALSFTPPQPGALTWSASDVSWQAVSWTGGTGVSGTMSNAGFNRIVTCGTGGCSTSGFTLQLAAKPAVARSGAHTLVVTWKIESLQ